MPKLHTSRWAPLRVAKRASRKPAKTMLRIPEMNGRTVFKPILSSRDAYGRSLVSIQENTRSSLTPSEDFTL
jgi:hypothetical protein